MDNPLYLSILFGFSLVSLVSGLVASIYSLFAVLVEDNNPLRSRYAIILVISIFILAIGASGFKYYTLIAGEGL